MVTETDFRAGPNGFSLNALGDSVHLYSASASGELTGWHHGFSFDASFNGVSFGRLVTSDGREHFVPQRERTLRPQERADRRIGGEQLRCDERGHDRGRLCGFCLEQEQQNLVNAEGDRNVPGWQLRLQNRR